MRAAHLMISSLCAQVRKEPVEVRQAAAADARAANLARRTAAVEKADARKRMKGKNKPSRRAARKKANIVEERKGPMRARVAGGAAPGAGVTREPDAAPADVPRALQRFYGKRPG